jgi:glycosyltransferase involved in cell wall biosynthesis
MGQWPKDVWFVLKGHGDPAYFSSLRERAASCGCGERLVKLDLGFQSYRDHCAALAGANVGWTVLEPSCDNWLYAATASNKRFECMALGIAQVSDRNPGVLELIEDKGCGLCVGHRDEGGIASTVRKLTESPEQCRKMGERGRDLHLRYYNYDHQFSPVLVKLMEFIKL